ncbi:tetratricopeptide repeat-containing sensor histidine kinase [Spirosoma arcticum]
MKTLLLTLPFLAWSLTAQAQTAAERDSLLRKLNALPVTANDTTRVNVLNALAFQYWFNKPDTTYLLSQQAYELARTLSFPAGQARALNRMAIAFSQLGDYAKALKLYGRSKEISGELNDTIRIAGTLNNMAYLYMLQGDWQKGLLRIQECYALYKTIAKPDTNLKATILSNIGECFYQLKQLDSARTYYNQALPLAKVANPQLFGSMLYLLGDVALAENNRSRAYSFYQKSIAVLAREDAYIRLNEAYYRLAEFYRKTARKDSTVHYARLSLLYGQKSAFPKGILKSSQLLTELYESQNDTEALRYYKIAVAAKDSLYSQDKMKQLLSLTFEEKQQAQQIEVAKANYRSTVRTYIFIGLLAVLGIIALVLYRTNRQKQRANALLQRQRDEIHAQRTKAENALTELRVTQTQLVQKEKMASLGELTAGIAHEIQNPLNFVTNFSEVSTELVAELRQEREKNRAGVSGERDETVEDEILGDLTQNLQKITHHGGRASAIVRGMLEHSRTGTSEKQRINLNALADEYLKIAYQGLRQSGVPAKDKDQATGTPERGRFNCALVTNFDPTISNVEVMPHELGRVLLNLYNNAFYAVQERTQNQQAGSPDHLEHYQPTVTVSTRFVRKNRPEGATPPAQPTRLGPGEPGGMGGPGAGPGEGVIEIRVSDNGTGISDAVKPKIFQPFFTTKPTGEGTGLGLSLSYDIITKGHQGSLLVHSQEGEGTEFVIQLPTAKVTAQDTV